MLEQVLFPLEGTELNTRVSFGDEAKEIFGYPDAVFGIDHLNSYGNDVEDEQAVSFDLDEALTIYEGLKAVLEAEGVL